MLRNHSQRNIAVLLAVAVVTVTVCGPAIAVERHAVVHDARLDSASRLVGHAVDSTGRPQAGIEVRVLQSGDLVTRGKTDQQGRFAIAMPRAGLYEVRVGAESSVWRVWTHRAAPPSSVAQVLVVSDSTVVRGQVAGFAAAFSIAAVGVGTYLVVDQMMDDDAT